MLRRLQGAGGSNQNTPNSMTRVALLLVLLCSMVSVGAHEYWIEATDYQLAAGDELVADIRNGQDFAGIAYPYNSQRFKHFYVLGPQSRTPVKSRLGDYPAVHQVVGANGLHTLVLETSERFLVYGTMEKFRTFLGYHGLEHVEDIHRQRGLPNANIRERYFRFAKALVQVGNATEDDSAGVSQNMLFELVALNSPYLSDSVHVQLLFNQQPLTHAQVEVFFRNKEKKVARSVLRTDEKGQIRFDTAQAGHYLINAVQLLQPRKGNAHWESLWASLTFERTE